MAANVRPTEKGLSGANWDTTPGAAGIANLGTSCQACLTPLNQKFSRRAFLAALPGWPALLADLAGQVSAEPKLAWAVSSGLWRHIPHCRFSDILDVMEETGFPGIRLVDWLVS